MENARVQFASKRECIGFLKREIIDGVKPFLADSAMSIAIRDSEKTNSKYISLCYPERDFNFDKDRLPYCVRISDHDSFSLFSRKKPHYELRVIPYLSASQKSAFDKLEEQHRHVSRIIHLVSLAQRKKLAVLLEQTTAEIEALVAQAQYSYTGSLSQVIREMVEIAIANPKSTFKISA